MAAARSRNSIGSGCRQRGDVAADLHGRLGTTMTSNIDYGDKIPNNVDLGRDRVLQRALEHWQPAYMGWWYDMGPTGSRGDDVYLRTAISVDPDGWAHFGYVKMPDYRWGIFLAPLAGERDVNFGVHK